MAKKTAAASAPGKSTEDMRWDRASLTDDEIRCLVGIITKKAPPKKAPSLTELQELATAAGMSLADCKVVLRRAQTPSEGAARPHPPRNPPKDSPKQRPNPGAPPKHPAPARKVASTGVSKPDLILNAITGKGATLGALMQLTGWQAHSVRGCIATLQTKGGHSIGSTKVDGERTYQLLIPAGPKEAAPAKAAAAAAKAPPRKVRVIAKKKAAPKAAKAKAVKKAPAKSAAKTARSGRR